jgi:hypothetical protein
MLYILPTKVTPATSVLYASDRVQRYEKEGKVQKKMAIFLLFGVKIWPWVQQFAGFRDVFIKNVPNYLLV